MQPFNLSGNCMSAWEVQVCKRVIHSKVAQVRARRESAMASLTESEAVFTARLKALGIESLQLLFNGKGWKTMSTFAFASSWTPGVGGDTAFRQKVLMPLLGSEDHIDVPKIRKAVL